MRKILWIRLQGCICVDMECSANAAAARFRGRELFQFFYAADNLDAKAKMVEEMIDANSTQGSWVGYSRMLQRNIRKSEESKMN